MDASDITAGMGFTSSELIDILRSLVDQLDQTTSSLEDLDLLSQIATNTQDLTDTRIVTARQEGASLDQIGAALGVSKQAIHQRLNE